MSTAIKLLHELADLGVVLEAVGNVLRYRPMEAVPSDLLQRMKEHKMELIDVLKPTATPTTPRSDRFRNWVQRPDCHGRMGWERPGLSTNDRTN